jgi:hypothetical protein
VEVCDLEPLDAGVGILDPDHLVTDSAECVNQCPGAGHSPVTLAFRHREHHVVPGVGRGSAELQLGVERTVVVGNAYLPPVLGHQVASSIALPLLHLVVSPVDRVRLVGVATSGWRLHGDPRTGIPGEDEEGLRTDHEPVTEARVVRKAGALTECDDLRPRGDRRLPGRV